MKRIDLPHKVCGATCMINGLEDLYEHKTGVRLPDWFLIYMSGMAGFGYIKANPAPVPRFVGWGARPVDQYRTLADVVGFTWQMSEGRAFKTAWQQAKDYIDAGTPVILGAVDMFHLPYYEKFYHTYHIPIHYILLVGYDDDRQAALVQDCDRAAVQALPYADLRAAWDVHVPGLSKKHTLFAFTFSDHPADVPTIARRALAKKAESMLHPPVSMFGVPGMRKLARELPGWLDEMPAEKYDACLRQLAEYTGTPPMLPARLLGDPNAPDDHTGGRAGFARVLRQLAQEYHTPAWAEAGDLLAQSGAQISALTERVVDVLLHERDDLGDVRALLEGIADLEAQAYALIAASVCDTVAVA